MTPQEIDGLFEQATLAGFKVGREERMTPSANGALGLKAYAAARVAGMIDIALLIYCRAWIYGYGVGLDAGFLPETYVECLVPGAKGSK